MGRALQRIKKNGLKETGYYYARRIKRQQEKKKGERLREKPVCLIDITQSAQQINARLRSAREPFVAFVDPDAKYDPDYFRNLLPAFADGRIGAICGKVRNHKKKGIKGLPKEATVWNAGENFSQCVILPYGVVYRRQVIQKKHLSFDETLTYGRDELFALQYAQVSPISKVGMKGVYQTGLELDESSDVTPQSNDRRWYFDTTLPLLEKLKKADGSLSRIAQFGLLYLTIQRFKSNQNAKVKMAFESPAEADEYLGQVSEVMRHIGDDVLFGRAQSVTWERYKKLYLAQLRDPAKVQEFRIRVEKDDAYLYLADSDTDAEVCKISEQHLSVITMHKQPGRDNQDALVFQIRMARCFPVDSYQIRFVNVYDDGTEHVFPASWKSELAGLVAFFDRDAARQDAFDVTVSLAEKPVPQQIYAEVCFGDIRIRKEIEFAKNWQNKLNTNDEYGYWFTGEYLLQSLAGCIQLRPAAPADRDVAEERLQAHLQACMEAAAKKPARQEMYRNALLWRQAYWETYGEFSQKRIWTYNDKGYKAGDNAEYALHYAAKQDDGIDKVFYIDPDCPDGIRLKQEGYHVLEPGSTEAILHALHAEVVYMTHVPPFHKMGLKKKYLPYFKDLLDAKVIRLYHGFPATRSSSYTQMAYDAAAVAIGTQYEADLYTDADNGFREDQLLKTGMPRYDDLTDDRRRQLLFAPTWRPSLTGKTVGTGASLYNPDFKESQYYQIYSRILNDPKLLETARRTGYRIRMFLHPKLSAQTIDFESNDVMDALSCTEDIDYVTIMRQSDLMVTDVSSVQYDFAYMRKPVVYYHDPALPYWRIITMDYEALGLGEICRSADELVRTLCDYMETDCTLKPAYKKRIEEFFIHSDNQSAKRLYEETLKLVGGN